MHFNNKDYYVSPILSAAGFIVSVGGYCTFDLVNTQFVLILFLSALHGCHFRLDSTWQVNNGQGSY